MSDVTEDQRIDRRDDLDPAEAGFPAYCVQPRALHPAQPAVWYTAHTVSAL